MEYRLLIAIEAYWDIEDAINYYRDKSGDDLKIRFKKELRKAFNYISKYPLSLAVRYKSIRICNLEVFPYQIHYLVEHNTIMVFGVFHNKTNPKSWSKQLRS